MATVGAELAAALAQHQAGNWERAEAAYRRLAARAPRAADVRYLLGSLYVQREQHAQALPFLEQAVALDPTQARFFNSLGVALKGLGREAEAWEANGRALELEPTYAEALNNRGILARAKGDLARAIASYEAAIAADPKDAQFHNNLGIAVKERIVQDLAVDEFNYEDYAALERAETHFRDAVRLAPNFAAAHNNLGATLRLLRRYEEAIVCVERALALQPDSEEAQINWGLLLYLLGFYDRAESQLRRMRALNPQAKGVLCGLADCARMQGRYREALSYLDIFLEDEPDDMEAQYARGQALLQLGRMEEGWRGYEWRLRRASAPQRDYVQPLWDGSALAGRTLLVHAEQGFGDAFQFARYLPLIQKDGGSVVFEAQPGTAELFARTPGYDRLVERPASNRTDRGVPHDVQIPLMSLARLFPHPADSPPAQEPYIFADPQKVAAWKGRLDEAQRAAGGRAANLKVGIIWAGNPKHGNDRNRSASLADFLPLAQVPGITLISLQKGPSEAQGANPPAGMHLVDLAPQIDSFSDTAAVLGCLDLLVSVDTSTAHLAGAMGRPVWLMTPFAPEWRWLYGMDTSPWYPSLRLFRQPVQRDWASVMARIASELRRQTLGQVIPQIEAAEALAANGERSRAKHALRQILDTHGPNPRALNDLGVLHWQEGAAAEALAAFQQALALAPEDQTTRQNCLNVLRAFDTHREAARLAA